MRNDERSGCSASVDAEVRLSRSFGRIVTKLLRSPVAGRVCFCATLLLACVEGVCGEQSGVELFIEACRHQGLNPAQIRSGYLEYEREIRTQPLSEREIQKRIDDHIELVRTQMAKALTDEGRRSVEKQIRDTPAIIRSHSGGIERSRLKLLFRGNDASDAYRRQEVAQFDPVTQRWDATPDVVLGHGVEDGADNVVWDPDINLAYILSTPLASEEILEAGRMQGLPCRTATAAFLHGTNPREFQFSRESVDLFKAKIAEIERGQNVGVYRLAGEQKYDGDAFATVVESSKNLAGNVQVLQRYWIDPARGYVCPLIEFYDDAGLLTERWKSSDYVLHEPSGLWFPALHIHARFDPKTRLLTEERTYRLDTDTLRINQPISDAEFMVQIPSKASVLDVRTSTQVRYKVTEPITLSLAKGGLDLASMPGVFLVSRVTAEKDVGRSRVVEWIGSLTWKHWLAAFNGLILLALLGVLTRKIVLARQSERASRGPRGRR